MAYIDSACELMYNTEHNSVLKAGNGLMCLTRVFTFLLIFSLRVSLYDL